MNFDQYKIYRDIMCIDLKSFYASAELVARGLDVFKTPLVVAAEQRGKGSVVLATSHGAKLRGVKSRCRLYELPTEEEMPDLIIAKPRMQYYLDLSAKIVGIYLDYVSEEDIHIYSIDEAFLDFTSYKNLYKKSIYDIAREIQDKIISLTGIPAVVGIGPNLLLSKISLDVEAKNNKDMIATWDYDTVPDKMWPIEPLSKFWGIGKAMEENLNKLGIYSIGDLANYDLNKLLELFGVMGEELYYHANGIDMSVISEGKTSLLQAKKETRKSYGIGQTLFYDYYKDNSLLLIKEMTDNVARTLRLNKQQCNKVQLGITYSHKVSKKGFYRSLTFDLPTSDNLKLFNYFKQLFLESYDGIAPIRKIDVRVGTLIDLTTNIYSLFEDIEQSIKRNNLYDTIDKIQQRFGNSSITRASSLLEDSTVNIREKYIGGHNAE